MRLHPARAQRLALSRMRLRVRVDRPLRRVAPPARLSLRAPPRAQRAVVRPHVAQQPAAAEVLGVAARVAPLAARAAGAVLDRRDTARTVRLRRRSRRARDGRVSRSDRIARAAARVRQRAEPGPAGHATAAATRWGRRVRGPLPTLAVERDLPQGVLSAIPPKPAPRSLAVDVRGLAVADV